MASRVCIRKEGLVSSDCASCVMNGGWSACVARLFFFCGGAVEDTIHLLFHLTKTPGSPSDVVPVDAVRLLFSLVFKHRKVSINLPTPHNANKVNAHMSCVVRDRIWLCGQCLMTTASPTTKRQGINSNCRVVKWCWRGSAHS